MFLKVVDAVGTSQQIIAHGQEAPTNKSGAIVVTGVSQALLAANAFRTGFVFQNRGSSPMHINDMGAAATTPGSFTVAPGAFFPPPGYPVTTAQFNVMGTLGDTYSAREW